MTGEASGIELDAGRSVWVLTFSANGQHLVGGDDEAVRVWRATDGHLVATMPVYDTRSIAVSNDGRFIAAGTELGRVCVWDTRNYSKIFTRKDNGTVRAVGLSPDSTQLVTASGSFTATVWNLMTGKQVLGPLHHRHGVVAARYSPQGDRIATYDSSSVRVYDSSSGELHIEISISVAVYCNLGLTWSNDSNHIFVVSGGKIKRLEVSSGSVASEWPIHEYQSYACIALSKHGRLMACSSNRMIHFWDVSTGIQLGQGIKHNQELHSIALSPDDRLLATSTASKKIIIQSLSGALCSFSGPFICVSGAVFDAWNRGQLAEAESLLTVDINSNNLNHCAYAQRSLVRAQLRLWDTAISDAENSINTQPSVIGYVAKSVALVCGGQKAEGYRACDFAFKYCHSDLVNALLLIKAVILFMAGEHTDAISRVGDLIATTHDDPTCYTLQAYMHLLHGNLRFEKKDYGGAMRSFEHAQSYMRRPHTSRSLSMISLMSGWEFDDLDITIQRHLCEALYTLGRVYQAEDELVKTVHKIGDMANVKEVVIEWVSDFIPRCLAAHGRNGGDLGLDQQERATKMNPSSHGSSTLKPLLAAWVRIKLASTTWKDVLVAAVDFKVPRIMVHRAICEHLEMTDCLTHAVDCFTEMVNELVVTPEDEDEGEWILDFQCRCSDKLEALGDAAMDSQCHDEAISWYSAALRLTPPVSQGLLCKRSKAYAAKGLWRDALNDANDIIKLNPRSPLGYKRRHAALLVEGCYKEAVDAHKMMISMISQSSEPDIRDSLYRYVKPEETEARIRQVIQEAIRDSPQFLIDTKSGRLLNKSKRASMFEASPLFMELVSSMTTHVDATRIKSEVAQYYCYAVLSHAWEEGDLAFEHARRAVVYDLEPSPSHDKLQTFCKMAWEAGFRWAWSDTCCLNKSDHADLQDGLVTMYRWYEASSLTVVFLRGVRSPSKRGDLLRSIWNTQAWTLQAYLASRVVQFYTEDWKPYLDLTLANHKESAEIISEMEEVTGISARTLAALRPGLTDIRAKLLLASRRETAHVEDAAYSLLGIFSTSLPVVYGEGDKALGRLLAHLLSHSGDTSILAWTGKPGSFNTCFPADIAAFNQLSSSWCIPSSTKAALTLDLSHPHTFPRSITMASSVLYEQLRTLPLPSVSGTRIRLPCITFRLGHPRRTSRHTFRARADALGIVEITTTEDITSLDSLYLIHPWIDILLDRQPVRHGDADVAEKPPRSSHDISPFCDVSSVALVGQRTPIAGNIAQFWQSLSPFQGKPAHKWTPLSPSSLVSPADRRIQVLQFIARLRQPFNALIFTSTGHKVTEYRRIATDTMVTVQIQQDTPLDSLLPDARMVDVV